MEMLLAAVKLSMAITIDDYDLELKDLIAAALMDMKSNGINVMCNETDPLILQAVKTYCRAMFQSPADYDRLLDSYNMQKGHLMHCTGYTTWAGEAKDDAEG